MEEFSYGKKGSDTGETVFDSSKIPSSFNKKLEPTDVYVNSNNDIYVSDQQYGYVWKLNSTDNIAEIIVDNLYNGVDVHNGVQGFYINNYDVIYIAIAGDDGENKIMKWSPNYGDKKARLIMGGSKGDGSKKFNQPYDISFDSKGDMYVADKWNHRIQKIKLSKSIVIPAGQTTSSLDINIIEDNSDEDDETVILTPGTVIGANNSNTDAVSFTITDDDDPPTITFTQSAESIEENSSTDLTVKAAVSIVSGKEIQIPFTLSGTADASEYSVSDSPLKISAGSSQGFITISTNGKDDSDVEIIESIILTYGDLVNASTTATSNTINLISDDNPNLSSIEVDKSEIYEHEKSVITATISAAHSKDTDIIFAISGTATLDEDYKIDPQIKIAAGQTSASIEISAIEEFPENAEDDETVILTPSVTNANLNSIGETTITIKNNGLEFEKKDNPFIKLSKSSISWGDYDRDGDMDLAIMGQSNSVGAVTAIYENKDGTFEDTNQNFTKVYDGDLSWVDLNKDGWLDLVVTGFNQTAKTNIYINNEGQTFETSNTDWGIPNAYASKMSWGDLDNDGDIDLALVGIDDQENGFSYLYMRIDGKDEFLVQDISGFSGGGFKYGDLEIADFDQDSDNDLIFTGERSWGELRAEIRLNSFISPTDPKYKNIPLTYSRDKEENIQVNLKNASITTYFNQQTKELSYIINGRDENNDLKNSC